MHIQINLKITSWIIQKNISPKAKFIEEEIDCVLENFQKDVYLSSKWVYK